jgi:hypothetical protein
MVRMKKDTTARSVLLTCAMAVIAALVLAGPLAGCRRLTAVQTTPEPAVEATSSVEATTPSAETTPADSGTSESTPTETDQDSAPPEEEAGKPVTVPGLWNLIMTERYRTWRHAPGVAGVRPGTGPHNVRIRIWVNDIGLDALQAEPRPGRFPAGTTIVKEGATASMRLTVIAAMRKQADGKWLFAEWRPNGTLIAGGVMTPGCANCHSQGQDHVRAIRLRP